MSSTLVTRDPSQWNRNEVLRHGYIRWRAIPEIGAGAIVQYNIGNWHLALIEMT